MSLQYSQPAEKRRKLLAGFATFVFVTLITIGVFAKNDWFPRTDNLTGARTGWFGSKGRVTSDEGQGFFSSLFSGHSSLPAPTPTPQLAKEYIYAGSRLLAVEDANANASPPADLAVWRPSTGTWWVMGGSNSAQVTQSWGTNGDKPVPGDYDGDGKTDFSIFRPSTGEWFVLQSSDNAWGHRSSRGAQVRINVFPPITMATVRRTGPYGGRLTASGTSSAALMALVRIRRSGRMATCRLRRITMATAAPI